MFHMDPMVGNLAHNCRLLEIAIDTAADKGAQWLIAPELCLCGYHFVSRIGTSWVAPYTEDKCIHTVRQAAARRRMTVFLSHPERDSQTGKLHNTVIVIGDDGTIVGTQRKIHVIPQCEGWSSPGTASTPIALPSVVVGILICADAYTPPLAKNLKDQGAQLLISSAAWGPCPHGPDGAWEARSRETGLPLFVCNRTGAEDGISFHDAESVVIKDGKRLLAFRGHESALLLIDWDYHAQTMASDGYKQVLILNL